MCFLLMLNFINKLSTLFVKLNLLLSLGLFHPPLFLIIVFIHKINLLLNDLTLLKLSKVKLVFTV